jgi:hypothetical protein
MTLSALRASGVPPVADTEIVRIKLIHEVTPTRLQQQHQSRLSSHTSLLEIVDSRRTAPLLFTRESN